MPAIKRVAIGMPAPMPAFAAVDNPSLSAVATGFGVDVLVAETLFLSPQSSKSNS